MITTISVFNDINTRQVKSLKPETISNKTVKPAALT
jgi:hypothetical protein